jgi:hypothetical protein
MAVPEHGLMDVPPERRELMAVPERRLMEVPPERRGLMDVSQRDRQEPVTGEMSKDGTVEMVARMSN